MHKKKLIIFIWEWRSECSFFESFIMRILWWISTFSQKNNILMEWNEYYILLAHPRMWLSHKWWDSELVKNATYIKINRIIEEHLYLFPSQYEIEYTYLIFTDDDSGSVKKIETVKESIDSYCPKFNWTIVPIIPKVMIETWFLSGIGKDFLANHPKINKTALRRVQNNSGIESISETKKILLDSVLKNTELGWWWQQAIVWRTFWELIDIDMAIKKCRSFNQFYDDIVKIFWLDS